MPMKIAHNEADAGCFITVHNYFDIFLSLDGNIAVYTVFLL